MADTRAIYPGTFDPITCGHVDLVTRAAAIFDHVIVAIAANPRKNTLFSVAERVDLARQSLLDLTNVQVCFFENLLVDFARQQQCTVIIRGLRAVSDFEYEFQLASMNRKLAEELETLFLMPAEQFAFVSSSLVKEIASLGGNISGFVNHSVKAALEAKFR